MKERESERVKITYSLLQEQFNGFNIAEAHGILTAILCGRTFDHYTLWLKEVENLNLNNESINEEILKILYDKTVADLSSKEFKLALLIPDEDEFSHRVEGFVNWCNGYLYGIGISEADLTALDEDGSDFIDYLTIFTQIDREEVMEDFSGEEDKLALEELIEFVRISAMLLYYQLRSREMVH